MSKKDNKSGESGEPAVLDVSEGTSMSKLNTWEYYLSTKKKAKVEPTVENNTVELSENLNKIVASVDRALDERDKVTKNIVDVQKEFENNEQRYKEARNYLEASHREEQIANGVKLRESLQKVQTGMDVIQKSLAEMKRVRHDFNSKKKNIEEEFKEFDDMPRAIENCCLEWTKRMKTILENVKTSQSVYLKNFNDLISNIAKLDTIRVIAEVEQAIDE